jgi:hypothetical protein
MEIVEPGKAFQGMPAPGTEIRKEQQGSLAGGSRGVEPDADIAFPVDPGGGSQKTEPFQDKGRPLSFLRRRGRDLRQAEQIRQQPVRQRKDRLPAEQFPRKGMYAPDSPILNAGYWIHRFLIQSVDLFF